MAQVVSQNAAKKGVRAETINVYIKQLGKSGSLQRIQEWLAGKSTQPNAPSPPKQLSTTTYNEIIYAFGQHGHLAPAAFFLE